MQFLFPQRSTQQNTSTFGARLISHWLALQGQRYANPGQR